MLHRHIISAPLLEMIDETLDTVKSKLVLGSAVSRGLLDSLLRNQSLVEYLLSKQNFIDVPGSEDKLSMDYDNIILIKGDNEVALIHPSFYRFQSNFILGWWVVFDNAPMIGTWTTAHWNVTEHFEIACKVFQRAFEWLESPQDLAVATATVDTWLIDVV